MSGKHVGFLIFLSTYTARLFVFILLVMWRMVAPQLLAAQIETRPFAHNGYSRPYLVYKSAHLAPHPPLVLMLGGAGSTAHTTAQDFGWIEEADRNGFLVVFPEPLTVKPDEPFSAESNVTFWENGAYRSHRVPSGKSPVDDDGYLIAVLHDVLRRDHPSSHRVFLRAFPADRAWCSYWLPVTRGRSPR